MKNFKQTFAATLFALGLATVLGLTSVLGQSAFAKNAGTSDAALESQKNLIRKNLLQRIPQLKKIDAIRSTPMSGLFEIQVDGSDIYYTDAQGNYLIQGHLIDTRAQRNLTQERIEKLSAIDFSSLALQDAFTIVRGNGKRKLAVFEDPNCGYCKQFERNLQGIDNVTVYLFLYPILGMDSLEKSKAIWCAPERSVAWQDWMLRDQAPSAAPSHCDSSALKRNVEFGRVHKIMGTPTLLLTNGSRVPGAIDAKKLEKMLNESASPRR